MVGGIKEYRRRKAEQNAERKKDLCNNRRAKVKDPITLFTGILAFCMLGLVFVGWLQWRTLEKTDQTLKAAQRPWVYADISIIKPITYSENEMEIALRFSFKNTGQTPALYVWPDFEVIAQKRGESPLARQTERCAHRRKTAADPREPGFTQFPNQSLIWNISTNIPKTDFTINLGNNHGAISPVIIGCIDYEFAFERGHHQTGFIYTIKITKPNVPGMFIIIPDDGTVPLENLMLTPEFSGGAFYAD